MRGDTFLNFFIVLKWQLHSILNHLLRTNYVGTRKEKHLRNMFIFQHSTGRGGGGVGGEGGMGGVWGQFDVSA